MGFSWKSVLLATSNKTTEDIIKKIQSIGYRFIWDGLRVVGWEKVALRNDKGSLDIMNIRTFSEVAVIRDATKLWRRAV